MTCLQGEGGHWQSRNLDRQRLELALHAPQLPKIADITLYNLHRRGLAEVHRHESLSKLPAHIWWYLLSHELNPDQWPTSKAPNGEPWHRLVQRARYLWQAIEGLIEHAHGSSQDLAKAEHRAIIALQPVDTTKLLHPPIGLTHTVKTPVDINIAEHPLCADRWLLIRALDILSQPNPPNILGVALHALILCRSMIESSLLHPPQGYRGLERFKNDFVDHAWQSEITVAPDVLWRQAWREGSVRWMEVKLGPGSKGPREKTLRWVEAARPKDHPISIKEAAYLLGTPDPKQERPAIRMVLHFLRRDDKHPISLSHRRPQWLSLRESIAQTTEQMRELLDDPILGQLWAGIDIASYELSTPAEVFAPAFRLLRAPWALGATTERGDHAPSLGLRSLAASVHAGEEFEHLAQGMRWIDEHLLFLGLRSGDRIGHALAIGVEPRWWREKTTGTITQSRQARLDDLVWLWKNLHIHPEHNYLCHGLMEEAYQLCQTIYQRRYDMGVLHEAWTLRQLDPLQGEPQQEPTVATRETRRLVQAAHRWQAECLSHASPDAIHAWRQYTWNPNAHIEGKRRIEVPISHIWDRPLRDLQNDLLRKLISHGIAIEANPSSNLAIATLGKMEYHPVFRWLPVDPSQRVGIPLPRVCIGSDDPAIFHTELLHEFALLAQAARETGKYTDRDIRNWLEELRQTGLDLWFGDLNEP